uniref:Uncharacterized protein n=1 Tax=Anguilla anguilla TaxID=7936 RepID=A0A0E9XCN3_ANGAN
MYEKKFICIFSIFATVILVRREKNFSC